jgi:glycosyltransferase involved in cell wall biosynthesis
VVRLKIGDIGEYYIYVFGGPALRIVERIVCGTPVLTFLTGGRPEVVDETCGCVVECDDVDAMEREIKRLCLNNVL